MTKANTEATKKHAETYPSIPYNCLGDTGLMLSQAGFGSYRLTDQEDHKEALKLALEMGINFIDTSSNYMDGAAEMAIGSTLKEMKVNRESIVLCSKAGYIQGYTWEVVKEQELTGLPFKEIVQVDDHCAHCMHPDFLDHQLQQSLDRLDVDCLDIFLIHNPEYFYVQNSKDKNTEKEFHKRIKNAFIKLESMVSSGKIQYYGVSSNTFPTAPDHPQHINLSKLVAIAEEISKDNHFKVIQFPFNLIETNAVIEQHDNNQSLLEVAKAANIGTLINRPLNAVKQNQLIRFAEYHKEDISDQSVITELVESLIEMENEFYQNHLTKTHPENQKTLQDVLSIGQNLKGCWEQFKTYVRWNEIFSDVLIRNFEIGLNILAQENDDGALESWVTQYAQRLNQLGLQLSYYYLERDEEKASQYKTKIETANPDWAKGKTLSQIAIRALRSTYGVDCVLVGMRQMSYVEDVLSELANPITVVDQTRAWNSLKL